MLPSFKAAVRSIGVVNMNNRGFGSFEGVKSRTVAFGVAESVADNLMEEPDESTNGNGSV